MCPSPTPSTDPTPDPNGERRNRTRLTWVALLVAALGCALYLPTLRTGLFLDDYLQMAEVQGHDVLPEVGPLSLFTFAQPIPHRMGPIQGDFVPWWASRELLISFQRPVASLTYHLDQALFGGSPTGAHAQNLFWWALLLVALVVLISKYDAGRGALAVAGVAGLFFALDVAREENVSWIASRHYIMSALWCCLALTAYHTWRRTGAARAGLTFLLWLLLALFTNEAALGVTGYLFAYELFLARGGLFARLRGIAPVLLAFGAFVALYVSSGHGAHGSGWYLDPIRDFESFLRTGLMERLPELMRTLILPAEAMPPRLRALLGASPALAEQLSWGLVGIALAAFLVTAQTSNATRFFLVGALIALLPNAAGPLSPRTLLLPSVGVAWAYAATLVNLIGSWRSSRNAPSGDASGPGIVGLCRWGLQAAASLLLVLQVLGDPPAALEATSARVAGGETLERNALEAELPVGDELANARVLLLTSPSGVAATYMPLIRLQQGRGWPEGIWTVSPRGGSHRLTRVDGRTLRIQPTRGSMVTGSWADLFNDEVRIPYGTVLRRGVLYVQVAQSDDKGKIAAVLVSLDLPLDSPDVWLVAWDGKRWTRIDAPEIGETITIGA